MGLGKKYQPVQVVNLLRQIEVAVENGMSTALALVSWTVEQTYFRWRRDQAKQLKGPYRRGRSSIDK